MKKLVLILLVCLLLYGVTQPATAQGPVIYLPIIVKGNEIMTTWAVLEISDGTPGGTVNLLSGGDTGFHLKDWNPQVIQPKEGGVFQDSPIAPGRRLVYAVDATAIETMTIDVNDYDEDALIEQAQDLMRLLNKARAYGGTTDYQDTPVYIRARSDCETNDRYAVIINWAIPELDNPYAPPFVVAREIALMDDLTLQLERGHWTANAPGVGTCVQASSQQIWPYANQWVVATTDPTDFVYSLLQASSDRIFAGDNAEIWYSDDDGVTWNASTASPTDFVTSLLQTTTGRILAGENGQILYSDNNGANWNVLTTSPVGFVYSLLQASSGRIFAGESGQIWYSDDNGATWASSTTLPLDSVRALLQTTSGRIMAADRDQIWYSDDNGASWYIGTTTIYPYSLLQIESGKILAGVNGQIWYSNDNGNTWSIATTNPSSTVMSLLQTTTGRIYAGEDAGQIWYSDDDGVTFAIATTAPVVAVLSLLETTTGKILAGEEGQIWAYTSSVTSATLGEPASCTGSIYFANKQNIANLTNIYIDDGGVFGANLFPMSVFPVTLLPAVPAVNDAIYFGIDTTIDNSGPFSSLVFDIATTASATTSYTITWEYWSGAAWTALTVQDGTNPGSGAFRTMGVSSVHWVQPSNWAANAVNGVTGYWVRARVSALVGVLTPPTQQNRTVYSVDNAFVDIDEAQVLGDIAAIAQIKAHNRSDYNGPEATAPNLYDNRLIAGLRSYGRGSTFQAYLNISDEQNPFGVTITLGTNTAFATDATAPTGRRATYNPGGVEAMATRATIALSSTIARDFYGTYHAFLRAQRTAGASTDLTVRLQVATGSGGITYTATSQQLQTTTSFEVLDFGEITLPVSSSFKSTDLADTTEIRIQASAASGTPDLNLYDLILIPVDEWAVDAVDMANESDSDVGRSNGIAKLLDIDSVTDPRIDIKTLVRTADASEFITAEYNPITGGGAILQANADQRLWFFAMMTSATGAAYYWIAPPEIAHSIQLWTNPRYLGMRGSR